MKDYSFSKRVAQKWRVMIAMALMYAE